MKYEYNKWNEFEKLVTGKTQKRGKRRGWGKKPDIFKVQKMPDGWAVKVIIHKYGIIGIFSFHTRKELDKAIKLLVDNLTFYDNPIIT